MSATINHAALVLAGKSQADGDDIRVVYWNGSGWVELDRMLDPGSSWNTSSTTIWFKLQTAIPPSASDVSYYVYYGNSSAGAPPATGNNVFYFYDGFESGDFSAWGGTATGTGDSISIATSPVHRGTYSAEAYVDDGSQAAAQNLFSAQLGFHTAVWLYLPSGYTASDYVSVVMYYRGSTGLPYGQWGSQLASLNIWTDRIPYIYNVPGGEFYLSDTPLTTGVWHRLEMKILVSDTLAEPSCG